MGVVNKDSLKSVPQNHIFFSNNVCRGVFNQFGIEQCCLSENTYKHHYMVSRDIHNSTTSVKTPLKTPNRRVPKNSHLEFLNILDACQKTLTNRSVLELFPYSIISSRETTKDTCSDTGILRPYLLRLSLFNNVYEKTPTQESICRLHLNNSNLLSSSGLHL